MTLLPFIASSHCYTPASPYTFSIPHGLPPYLTPFFSLATPLSLSFTFYFLSPLPLYTSLASCHTASSLLHISFLFLPPLSTATLFKTSCRHFSSPVFSLSPSTHTRIGTRTLHTATTTVTLFSPPSALCHCPASCLPCAPKHAITHIYAGRAYMRA